MVDLRTGIIQNVGNNIAGSLRIEAHNNVAGVLYRNVRNRSFSFSDGIHVTMREGKVRDLEVYSRRFLGLLLATTKVVREGRSRSIGRRVTRFDESTRM